MAKKTKDPRSGSYRHQTKQEFDLSLFGYAVVYFGVSFLVLYTISLAFSPEMAYTLIFESIVSFIYAIQMTLHRKRYEDARKKESIESKKFLDGIRNNIETEKRAERFESQRLEAEVAKAKLESELKEVVSYNHHLADVISGINHEISPWIGGISNMLSRLTGNIEEVLAGKLENRDEIRTVLEKTINKHHQVFKACDQAMNILTNMSLDVKTVKNYSVADYNIKDTVTSWVRIILMDRKIKESINEQHIEIDECSLDFVARHSPMLISQIILNLAKNTVEHNRDNLENVRIKIYGDRERKRLVYEDNGKGMQSSLIKNVFVPGFTTKADKTQHGFGLAACYDYCLSMGAIVNCESVYGEYVKFTIEFEKDSSGEYESIVKTRKTPSNKIMKTLEEESNH